MTCEIMKKFFNVDNPTAITQEHIEKIVQAGEMETIYLEFKGAAAYSSSPVGIAKAISAFANSSGGLLIVGIAADQDDDDKPGKAKDLDPLPIGLTKEGFQQRLFGFVDPWPFNTYIQDIIVQKNGTKGRVFLVDVVGEHYPPVQVVQKGYYFRLNGVSQPMTAHLVTMAYGKGMKPLITPDLEIYGCEQIGTSGMLRLRLRVTLRNAGRIAATSVAVLIERWDAVGREMNIKATLKFTDISERVHKDTGQPAAQCTVQLPVYVGVPILIGEVQIDFFPTAAIKIRIASIETSTQTFKAVFDQITIKNYIKIYGVSSDTNIVHKYIPIKVEEIV